MMIMIEAFLAIFIGNLGLPFAVAARMQHKFEGTVQICPKIILARPLTRPLLGHLLGHTRTENGCNSGRYMIVHKRGSKCSICSLKEGEIGKI